MRLYTFFLSSLSRSGLFISGTESIKKKKNRKGGLYAIREAIYMYIVTSECDFIFQRALCVLRRKSASAVYRIVKELPNVCICVRE